MMGLAADTRLPALYAQTVMADDDEQHAKASAVMASIDQSLRDLNASLTDVTMKVHRLEERSNADAEDRREMQASLNALNMSVNQMIGKLGTDVKKPWYSEPAFHLAVLAGVLLFVLAIRELGTDNTSKLIDHIPTSTLGG